MLDLICVICQEAFSETDRVYATPCGHIFHQSYINKWLRDSSTCPQCRKVCFSTSIYKLYLESAVERAYSGNPKVQLSVDGYKEKILHLKRQLAMSKSELDKSHSKLVQLKDLHKRVESNLTLEIEKRVMNENRVAELKTVNIRQHTLLMNELERRKLVNKNFLKNVNLCTFTRNFEKRIAVLERYKLQIEGKDTNMCPQCRKLCTSTNIDKLFLDSAIKKAMPTVPKMSASVKSGGIAVRPGKTDSTFEVSKKASPTNNLAIDGNRKPTEVVKSILTAPSKPAGLTPCQQNAMINASNFYYYPFRRNHTPSKEAVDPVNIFAFNPHGYMVGGSMKTFSVHGGFQVLATQAVPSVPSATKAATTNATPKGSTGAPLWGGQLKKPSNEWECSACMVRNKETVDRCFFCTTPRAKPVTGPTLPSSNSMLKNTLGGALKPNPDTWQCSACTVWNKNEAIKCVVCNTRKPAATVLETKDVGFKSLVAQQTTSKWKCDACMTRNDAKSNKCVGCHQTSSFGFTGAGAKKEVEVASKTDNTTTSTFSLTVKTDAGSTSATSAHVPSTCTAPVAVQPSSVEFGLPSTCDESKITATPSTSTITSTSSSSVATPSLFIPIAIPASGVTQKSEETNQTSTEGNVSTSVPVSMHSSTPTAISLTAPILGSPSTTLSLFGTNVSSTSAGGAVQQTTSNIISSTSSTPIFSSKCLDATPAAPAAPATNSRSNPTAAATVGSLLVGPSTLSRGFGSLPAMSSVLSNDAASASKKAELACNSSSSVAAPSLFIPIAIPPSGVTQKSEETKQTSTEGNVSTTGVVFGASTSVPVSMHSSTPTAISLTAPILGSPSTTLSLFGTNVFSTSAGGAVQQTTGNIISSTSSTPIFSSKCLDATPAAPAAPATATNSRVNPTAVATVGSLLVGSTTLSRGFGALPAMSSVPRNDAASASKKAELACNFGNAQSSGRVGLTNDFLFGSNSINKSRNDAKNNKCVGCHQTSSFGFTGAGAKKEVKVASKTDNTAAFTFSVPVKIDARSTIATSAPVQSSCTAPVGVQPLSVEFGLPSTCDESKITATPSTSTITSISSSSVAAPSLFIPIAIPASGVTQKSEETKQTSTEGNVSTTGVVFGASTSVPVSMHSSTPTAISLTAPILGSPSTTLSLFGTNVFSTSAGGAVQQTTGNIISSTSSTPILSSKCLDATPAAPAAPATATNSRVNPTAVATVGSLLVGSTTLSRGFGALPAMSSVPRNDAASASKKAELACNFGNAGAKKEVKVASKTDNTAAFTFSVPVKTDARSTIATSAPVQSSCTAPVGVQPLSVEFGLPSTCDESKITATPSTSTITSISSSSVAAPSLFIPIAIPASGVTQKSEETKQTSTEGNVSTTGVVFGASTSVPVSMHSSTPTAISLTAAILGSPSTTLSLFGTNVFSTSAGGAVQQTTGNIISSTSSTPIFSSKCLDATPAAPAAPATATNSRVNPTAVATVGSLLVGSTTLSRGFGALPAMSSVPRNDAASASKKAELACNFGSAQSSERVGLTNDFLFGSNSINKSRNDAKNNKCVGCHQTSSFGFTGAGAKKEVEVASKTDNTAAFTFSVPVKTDAGSTIATSAPVQSTCTAPVGVQPLSIEFGLPSTCDESKITATPSTSTITSIFSSSVAAPSLFIPIAIPASGVTQKSEETKQTSTEGNVSTTGVVFGASTSVPVSMHSSTPTAISLTAPILGSPSTTLSLFGVSSTSAGGAVQQTTGNIISSTISTPISSSKCLDATPAVPAAPATATKSRSNPTAAATVGSLLVGSSELSRGFGSLPAVSSVLSNDAASAPKKAELACIFGSAQSSGNVGLTNDFLFGSKSINKSPLESVFKFTVSTAPSFNFTGSRESSNIVQPFQFGAPMSTTNTQNLSDVKGSNTGKDFQFKAVASAATPNDIFAPTLGPQASRRKRQQQTR